MGFDRLRDGTIRTSYYSRTSLDSDSLVNDQILRGIATSLLTDASFTDLGFPIPRLFFQILN